MKIGPYYQRQKCRPVTLTFCRYIWLMRIFAGEGTSNDSGVVLRTAISVFAGYFFSSETLRDDGSLLCSDTQSAVGFSVIPKCMTLNGYFALNSVFAPVCLYSDCANFKNNCMKTNKDRHILSAAQIFFRDSSFW